MPILDITLSRPSSIAWMKCSWAFVCVHLQLARVRQRAQRVQRQVRVHRRRAVAEEAREVVHLARLGRLHARGPCTCGCRRAPAAGAPRTGPAARGWPRAPRPRRGRSARGCSRPRPPRPPPPCTAAPPRPPARASPPAPGRGGERCCGSKTPVVAHGAPACASCPLVRMGPGSDSRWHCSGVSSKVLPSGPSAVASVITSASRMRIDGRVGHLREELVEVVEEGAGPGRSAPRAACPCPWSPWAPCPSRPWAQRASRTSSSV